MIGGDIGLFILKTFFTLVVIGGGYAFLVNILRIKPGGDPYINAQKFCPEKREEIRQRVRARELAKVGPPTTLAKIEQPASLAVHQEKTILQQANEHARRHYAEQLAQAVQQVQPSHDWSKITPGIPTPQMSSEPSMVDRMITHENAQARYFPPPIPTEPARTRGTVELDPYEREVVYGRGNQQSAKQQQQPRIEEQSRAGHPGDFTVITPDGEWIDMPEKQHSPTRRR